MSTEQGGPDQPSRTPVRPVGRGPMRSWLINAHRLTLLTIFWGLVRAWVWVRGRVHIPRWLGSDSREAAVRLWTIAWLMFVWVLLWGVISWANIIVGIVLAIIIQALLPLPRVPVEGRIHPVSLLVLIARLIGDFFVSSAQVAWTAIRPGRPPLGAVIRVRVAIKSDMVLTLAVDYLNLVPGTMVLDIDHRRRILYVHVFDVRSDKKVRQFYKQVAFVERMFIKTFERDSEWHPSPYHGIDDNYRPQRQPTSTTVVPGDSPVSGNSPASASSPASGNSPVSGDSTPGGDQ